MHANSYFVTVTNVAERINKRYNVLRILSDFIKSIIDALI